MIIPFHDLRPCHEIILHGIILLYYVQRLAYESQPILSLRSSHRNNKNKTTMTTDVKINAMKNKLHKILFCGDKGHAYFAV